MFLTDATLATSRAYINNEWVDGGIKVINAKLSSYGEAGGQAGVAIPGFVDLQVHGHGGVDILAAKSVDDIRKLSRSLYANGVIAYLPTLITGPKELSLGALKLIEEVRKNPIPKPKKNKENPKKERKYDEMRLVHGLLRCKSGCGSWNRDRNGSSNIYKIAYQAIHNLERPSYLCREIKSNQAVLPNCYKQNIHKV